MLALLTASPAWAEEDGYADTGNYWHGICNSTAKERPYSCTTYAMGIVNGVIAQASYSNTIKPYCAPRGVTFGQYSDVFFRYLNNHPENRHLDATVLAIKAWSEAFPCQMK
jgi:hypothetical protein